MAIITCYCNSIQNSNLYPGPSPLDVKAGLIKSSLELTDFLLV